MYLAFRILLDTGNGVGKCLEIKVKDIDLNYRRLYLYENTKRKVRDRYV